MFENKYSFFQVKKNSAYIRNVLEICIRNVFAAWLDMHFAWLDMYFAWLDMYLLHGFPNIDDNEINA